MRQSLREATHDVHERLHRHAAFAAIQNGTADLAQYRALLVRLYGFYLPFEAAVKIEAERSTWLREDLAAVTIGRHALHTIPRCTSLPCFDTPGRRLGALYVAEGSTLGGRRLARDLDPLLGSLEFGGRRFFLGRGSNTGTAWSDFLVRLTASGGTPAACEEIVDSAVKTFGIFEDWLRGWSTVSK